MKEIPDAEYLWKSNYISQWKNTVSCLLSKLFLFASYNFSVKVAQDKLKQK